MLKLMSRDRWFNYIEEYVLLGALPLNEGDAAAVSACCCRYCMPVCFWLNFDAT